MSDEWDTPTERRLAAELDALSIAAMGRPGALTVDVLNEILQDRIDSQRECARLTAELAELRAWKDEALAVEREWDAQAVAKMLGVGLGQSCRKGIAEKVPAVLKELAELKKGEPTDAELMAAAVDAQRRADNYAKKVVDLDAELAELRAACEPIRRCAKLSTEGTASFIQWYELLPLAALLGKKP